MPIAASRLPAPCRPELEVVHHLLGTLHDAHRGALDWSAVIDTARPWVQAVRDKPAPFWAMESLLREYPISSAEGLAMMATLFWDIGEAAARLPRR